MTEAEWRDAVDARPMAKVVAGHPVGTDRKLRLFLTAFWRWQADNLEEPDRADLLRRVGAMEVLAETGKLPKGFRRSRSATAVFFGDAGPGTTGTAAAPYVWTYPYAPRAAEVQPPLLRDIFGPLPFREVSLGAHCRTPLVVSLARGIYEERAFDRLPILGDALEEAGCDDAKVLEHLRGGGDHVLGCWALDLVLGLT